MKHVIHPLVQDLELPKVLQALGDPVRLQLVRMLATQKDLSCSALCLGRPKSSMSHHFKIMINAGVLRVDVVGNTHLNNLRCDDLESRFPGLMASVVQVDKNPFQSARVATRKKRNQPASGRALRLGNVLNPRKLLT